MSEAEPIHVASVCARFEVEEVFFLAAKRDEEVSFRVPWGDFPPEIPVARVTNVQVYCEKSPTHIRRRSVQLHVLGAYPGREDVRLVCRRLLDGPPAKKDIAPPPRQQFVPTLVPSESQPVVADEPPSHQLHILALGLDQSIFVAETHRLPHLGMDEMVDVDGDEYEGFVAEVIECCEGVRVVFDPIAEALLEG